MCWAMLLLGGWNARAVGQQVSLRSQTEYRMTETKSLDGRLDSSASLTPFYVLTLRGPVKGGMNVYLDLGLTGYSSSSPTASVDQRNFRFNLMAQGTRLDLVATLTRDSNRVSLARPEPGNQVSLVTADSYAVSGVLSYPSYPTLSLQYQKSIVSPDQGGKLDTASHLIGANYEWGPFRITADDTRQEAGFSGASATARTYGISFSESALPTLRLNVDHYSTVAEVMTRGTQSGTSSQVTRARVSALPTPFLTLDADLALSTSSQDASLGGGQGFNGQESSVYLRSEVVPGVQLDLSTSSRTSRSALASTSSSQNSGSLAAQLFPNTSLLANWTRSAARDSLGSATSDQRGGTLSLVSEISPETDLSASYGRTRQGFADVQQDIASTDLGITKQIDPTLALGTSYHRYRQATLRAGDRSQSTLDALQLDATWLPDPLWGLRFGLGVARDRGDSRGLSLIPSFDLRWEMAPATTVTLRYVLRTIRESTMQGGAITTTSETSTGLTGRLTHSLANGGAFQVVYDYQKGFLGPFVWQKVLQFQYTRTH
jgi:hypothetical protein